MAKVLFKRKTTNEIKDLEVEDGALIYNTDNGKTYMDFGENRIQTGGNADTMITIGGEETPTDTDIKIWIKDKDNQNYNNFYYRKNDNKFEQMFLQPTGDTLPVGSISAYGGENIPTNWLKCNGEAISRTDYPDLFKAIGTTYGSGDGSTTFNVPDFIGRVPVGLDKEDTDFDTLGETGGEKTHKLTISEMPAHKHGAALNSPATTNFSGSNVWGVAYSKGSFNQAYIDKTGGSQAHNNMQPYTVTNFIIKAKQSVGVVGTVTSNINDTNDNAVPSTKTVKDYVKETYSTDEVKTNKVWIDGKPIYRKVLIFNKSVLNIGITDLNHNIVNFNSIINVKGFLTRIQSKVYNVIPWNSSENWKIIIGDITENAIAITIGEGLYTNIKDVILIIEYTKTTD